MKLRVTYPATPVGKRRVHTNIYGNVVGYVAGKRFWEFGDDEVSADLWLNGATLENAIVYRSNGDD